MPRYLCLGACGMGMAPLELYLEGEGHDLALWDDSPNPSVQLLLQSHRMQWVASIDDLRGPFDGVIYSSAIPCHHPFRVWARDKGIPEVARGVFLAQKLAHKRLIAVTGSHGKTTTTALLIHALKKAGFPCSYLLGGLWKDPQLKPGFYHPESPYVVAEIDESDGSILDFNPELTIILNLSWDHMAHYPTFESLKQAFEQLIHQTQKVVFSPQEHEAIDSLRWDTVAQRLPFSPLEGKNLSGPGWVMNAWNAGAVAQVVEFLTRKPFDLQLLMDFPGVRRRQDLHWDTKALSVWGDYAHHPFEVESFLRSMKQQGDKRLVVVFQPHRYTRTASYLKEFAAALSLADEVILLPVYGAGEAKIVEGSIEALAEAFLKKPLILTIDEGSVCDKIYEKCASGPTHLCFVGAGDIEILIKKFLSFLQANGIEKA